MSPVISLSTYRKNSLLNSESKPLSITVLSTRVTEFGNSGNLTKDKHNEKRNVYACGLLSPRSPHSAILSGPVTGGK